MFPEFFLSSRKNPLTDTHASRKMSVTSSCTQYLKSFLGTSPYKTSPVLLSLSPVYATASERGIIKDLLGTSITPPHFHSPEDESDIYGMDTPLDHGLDPLECSSSEYFLRRRSSIGENLSTHTSKGASILTDSCQEPKVRQ